MRILFLLFLFCLFCPEPVHAQNGDTKIQVVYKSKWIKVRPNKAEGVSIVKWNIVLHPNGKIDDSWTQSDGAGGRQEATLGGNGSGGVFRVIDKSTITRTWDSGAHIDRLTIRVLGKSCKAKYEYLLKPGEKEYTRPSGFFSLIKMIESSCSIESV